MPHIMELSWNTFLFWTICHVILSSVSGLKCRSAERGVNGEDMEWAVRQCVRQFTHNPTQLLGRPNDPQHFSRKNMSDSGQDVGGIIAQLQDWGRITGNSDGKPMKAEEGNYKRQTGAKADRWAAMAAAASHTFKGEVPMSSSPCARNGGSQHENEGMFNLEEDAYLSQRPEPRSSGNYNRDRYSHYPHSTGQQQLYEKDANHRTKPMFQPSASNLNFNYELGHRNSTPINDDDSSQLSSLDDCMIHCVFQELKMLDERGRLNKERMQHQLTQNVNDRKLVEFLQFAVEDCFMELESISWADPDTQKGSSGVTHSESHRGGQRETFQKNPWRNNRGGQRETTQNYPWQSNPAGQGDTTQNYPWQDNRRGPGSGQDVQRGTSCCNSQRSSECCDRERETPSAGWNRGGGPGSNQRHMGDEPSWNAGHTNQRESANRAPWNAVQGLQRDTSTGESWPGRREDQTDESQRSSEARSAHRDSSEGGRGIRKWNHQMETSNKPRGLGHGGAAIVGANAFQEPSKSDVCKSTKMLAMCLEEHGRRACDDWNDPMSREEMNTATNGALNSNNNSNIRNGGKNQDNGNSQDNKNANENNRDTKVKEVRKGLKPPPGRG